MDPKRLIIVGLVFLFSAEVAAQARWVERPTARYRRDAAASAFDSARQRVVMFGGWWRASLDDTIEWNGTAWVARVSQHRPPAQSGHAMTYDAQRGNTVLLGVDGTWLWNGLDWVHASPAQQPPTRTLAALSYDPVRARVVLFGGRAGTTPLNDTWEWDGQNWFQRNPLTSPPASSGHALAWDPVSQQTLLFTGQTWSWNGTGWARHFPTYPPEPGVQMTTDPLRRRIIAVKQGPTGYVSEWDGSEWQGVVSSLPPYMIEYPWDAALQYDGSRVILGVLGGYTHAYDGVSWAFLHYGGISDMSTTMIADTVRRRVVARSGYSNYSLGLDGRYQWTLEWAGGMWNYVPSFGGPSPVNGYAAAFDVQRQRTVIFGGNDLNTTWEWDGSAWTQRALTASPPGRSNAVMVFDTARSRLVLFGGSSDLGQTLRDDTWELVGSGWIRRLSTTTPPAGVASSAAFDEVRQRMVVVLHVSPSPGAFQTWEWDGLDWALRDSATWPPIELVTYDARRRSVVGVRPSLTSQIELWSWTGSAWRFEEPTGVPSTSGARGLVFDPQVSRLVIKDVVGAMWTETLSAAYSIPRGNGCAGTRGIPTLAARGLPIIANGDFELELNACRGNAPATVLFGANPGSTRIGACTVLVDSVVWMTPLSTSASGFAQLRLPIPGDVNLLGLGLQAQAIAFDPQGAFLGAAALTQGLEIRVGD